MSWFSDFPRNLGTSRYINDGQVPTTLPPSGPAGGDLTNTYPNPTLIPTGPGVTGPIGSATITPVVSIDAKGCVTALTQVPTSTGTGVFTFVDMAVFSPWVAPPGITKVFLYGRGGSGGGGAPLATDVITVVGANGGNGGAANNPGIAGTNGPVTVLGAGGYPGGGGGGGGRSATGAAGGNGSAGSAGQLWLFY